MKKDRKDARDRLLAINTRDELRTYLDSLNLHDDEREIAMLVFGRGWSLTQIQMEKGYSRSHLRRKLSKVYDRMI